MRLRHKQEGFTPSREGREEGRNQEVGVDGVAAVAVVHTFQQGMHLKERVTVTIASSEQKEASTLASMLVTVSWCLLSLTEAFSLSPHRQ